MENLKLDSNKGNTTIAALFLLQILSLFFIFFLFQAKMNYSANKDRLKTYLCFKYLSTKSKKYVKKIATINLLIPPLKIAGPYGKMAIETLNLTQKMIHLFYIKSIMKNNYCSHKQTLPFLLNLPYRTNGKIILKHTGGIVFNRRRKWSISISNDNLKLKPFFIRLNFMLTGPFSRKLKITSKEVPLNFKRFSGWGSFL